MVLIVLKKRRIKKYILVMEFSRLTLTLLISIDYVFKKFWASWFILFTTPIAIWLYPSEWKERIFGISINLFSPLVLLSSSYEPVYFLLFSIFLQNCTFQKNLSSEAKINVLSTRDLSTAAFMVSF